VNPGLRQALPVGAAIGMGAAAVNLFMNGAMAGLVSGCAAFVGGTGARYLRLRR
jgi:hypothetical protein